MRKIPDNLIIKKITPPFTTVITSMEKYKTDIVDNNGLIRPDKLAGALKEFQTVLAVGNAVRSCKVGDLVKINPERYAEYKQRQTPNIAEEIEGYHRELVGYKFKVMELNGESCLVLQDNDIDFVIEEFESADPPILLDDTKPIL